ncbi:ABC transporter permease [Gorillibacterium massiliense]|uniref:ABC transporter permease n=1 Tax=Gorillibacterium massiliense TaxID=1280390 RepID=UPI0005938216|nr:ABC-2 family transporter protein [Gorillibacterium massiliense]
MRLRRGLFLYRRLFTQQLRAILEYQADFFIMIGAAVLTQLLGFIFLWVVYQRIPDINGWKFWEVTFMYAMVFFTEGVGSLFFEGTWRLTRLVNMGELDRYLLRPMPTALQIFTTGIGMNGIGNIILGLVIIGQSLGHIDIKWTTGKIVVGIVLFVSAIVIRVAINFAANCAGFWIKSSGNAFPLMVHSFADFAKYPISIFSIGLQAFISAIVPFAFISFFPAAYLFGKESWGWIGLFGPLVAVYCVGMAYLVFRIGLSKYESVGN